MSNKYQWLWKSNSDAWSSDSEAKWTTYSDIEMTIIEEAHRRGEDEVPLDVYIIDLKRLLQINQDDITKQRPIKRIADVNLQCIREERFTLPNDERSFSRRKSFEDDGQYVSPKFIEEWAKRNPRIRMGERIKKAAQGILDEGHLLGKFVESQWLANQLLEVEKKSWNIIAQRCIHIYTRESFLYKLLNKTLRDEDLSKVDTLGPFCDLLWNTLTSEELKSKYQFTGLVYRGATLTDEEIQAYKDSIRKTPKEWLGFSSTSKARDLADMYSGNTLFIIKVPSQSQHLDISTLSNFPDEQEVLLGASTSFQTENVTCDEQTKKNYIHLRILW